MKFGLRQLPEIDRVRRSCLSPSKHNCVWFNCLLTRKQVFDETPLREAGVVLLVCFLCVMNIMLLNLLIAILATAHAKVQLNADKEAVLSEALIITQYR